MQNIMVTGAGRGIGHALVERLLSRGHRVFACVRKPEDESKFTASEQLEIVIMDVSDTASVEAAFVSLEDRLQGGKLNAVLHCAAISYPDLAECMAVESLENTLNTNTVGSFRVAKAAIPLLRGHGGKLVLTTSLWGRLAGPVLSSYCMSKHAVEALADILRRETRGMDMHVVLAEPGVVKTDMYETQVDEIEKMRSGMPEEQQQRYANFIDRYAELVKGGGGAAITAEKAADAYEKILNAKKPKPRYRFGIDSKVVCFLAWLLPDRLMDFVLGQAVNHKPV